MMSLTPEIADMLAKPFPREGHRFIDGNIYLVKSAIRRRLTLADPAWKFTDPELVSVVGDVVVMRATLTVAGVTRCGIGTGIITRTKKDKQTGEIIDLSAYDLARNTAKAFKTAASDCLPRAALEFNVGAYLKEPDIPKSEAALRDFLARLPPPPQPSAAALDAADLAALDVLARKHTGIPLSDLLQTLELGALDVFTRAFPTLDAARKVIAGALVDKHHPALVYQIAAESARNGSLYLSLGFGFNTVAVFNGDVDRLFQPTPFLLTGWRKDDFALDLKPPVSITMSRDTKGYPRVDALALAETADASH